MLAAAVSCSATGPSPWIPAGAELLAPPPEFSVWFDRTQSCSGRSGSYRSIEFYVVPGVDTFPTDQGPKVGMWLRRGDRHAIVLAGNWSRHEMVVRHEMLHSLLGQAGHPDTYFTERCRLTWEAWPGT